MSIIHNKQIGSPDLEASIVESILTMCIDNGVSTFELYRKMQTIPHTIIKCYLFYLIDYEILFYDSQKKKFIAKCEGYELLDEIDKEKRQQEIDINDITITFEFRHLNNEWSKYQ
jgi:hypothetical protein